MTTMEFQELIKLGFNKNEAKVYLSLANLGKTNASQIIKDTKFHKNIVYDNQEKEIKEKKAVAERLSKELNNNIKKTYEKQEAEIYRGVRGIKTFFNETLNSDGFVAFGGPPESVSILGEDFW